MSKLQQQLLEQREALHEQREEAWANFRKANSALEEAEAALEALDQALLPLLTAHIELADDAKLVIAEGHTCPSSPVGVCIFDDANDEDHDWCLFCGEKES